MARNDRDWIPVEYVYLLDEIEALEDINVVEALEGRLFDENMDAFWEKYILEKINSGIGKKVSSVLVA